MTDQTRRQLLRTVLAGPLLVAEPVALAHVRRFSYAAMHKGMPARISLFAASEAEAIAAARRGFARIAEIDNALSDFRVTSESARLTATPGSFVRVSQDLFKQLTRAREFHAASDGEFDITLGSLTRLKRDCLRAKRLPSGPEIERARQSSGWDRVEVDSSGNAVQLEVPGIALDFGGIGKGYACEEAVHALREAGIESSLVEIGGDIALGAAPPGESGWAVGIPHADRVLRLADVSVSTSGPDVQQTVIGGRRLTHYSHHDAEAATVSVVTRSGADADALATCTARLGRTRGEQIADRLGVAVRVVSS